MSSEVPSVVVGGTSADEPTAPSAISAVDAPRLSAIHFAVTLKTGKSGVFEYDYPGQALRLFDASVPLPSTRLPSGTGSTKTTTMTNDDKKSVATRRSALIVEIPFRRLLAFSVGGELLPHADQLSAADARPWPVPSVATAVFIRYVPDCSGCFSGFEVKRCAFVATQTTAAARNVGMTATAAAELLAAVNLELRRFLYPRGPLHFVAFVSPISGKGKGVSLWNSIGLTMLRYTQHSVTTIVTTHRFHAEEEAERNESYDRRHVLVAVGGDGMLHEVVNGLQRRKCRAAATLTRHAEGSTSEAAATAAGSVAAWTGGYPIVALFPTGSGCGLAKTLNLIDEIDAGLAMVHTHTSHIDLMRIAFSPPPEGFQVSPYLGKDVDIVGAQGKPPPPDRYAFLCVSFAFANDIDRGSEFLRFMGGARFSAYAVGKIIGGVPEYKVKVRVIPAPAPIAEPAIGIAQLQHRDESHSTRGPAPASAMGPGLSSYDAIKRHVPGACGRMTGEACPYCDAATSRRAATAEAATSSPSSAQLVGWQPLVVDPPDTFTFIMAANVPYIARDMKLAPHAHLSDGCFDLVYTDGKVTRAQLVGAMIDMEEGTHFEAMAKQQQSRTAAASGGKTTKPPMEYVKCLALEVAPITGFVMADGEVLPFGTVTVVSMPGAVEVVRGTAPMTRPIA